MVYHNSYQKKEDMQDDSFNELKFWMQVTNRALFENDAYIMFKGMDVFYVLLHSRMKPDEAKNIGSGLRNLRNLVNSPAFHTSDIIKSRAFDQARDLWEEFTGILNRMGVLFRLFSDPNIMITQRADQ